MAEKVIIDTLEIEETAKSFVEEPTEIKEEMNAKPRASSVPTWLWSSALAILVLALFCGTLYWRFAIKRPPAPPPSKIVQPASSDQRLTMVNDFIVAVEDDKGHNRLMICDLTFELKAGQNHRFLQKTMEVRNIIYGILRKEMIVSLMNPGARGRLKGEIYTEVNNLIGKDVVTDIYFTKFVLL